MKNILYSSLTRIHKQRGSLKNLGINVYMGENLGKVSDQQGLNLQNIFKNSYGSI